MDPYPPRAGEPTEICVKVRNHTGFTQTVQVQFSVANFGIGLPFVPIGPLRLVELPPYSEKLVCVKHIFTYGGHFCVQVQLSDPAGEYRPVKSQRNLDVAEFLEPGKVEYFEVPVGNPFPDPVTITLALVNHVPGWEMDYEPKVIPNAPPWPAKPTQVGVWLTPTGDLAELEDGKPVLHLEAYANGELIGGIRKVFRPPVPIHRPADPVYAEREITVHPYPPRAREPTEVCVELRNPTMFTQTVTVRFFWAYFGIGLPFHQINGPRPVVLPPHSVVKECITWIPPVGGRACIKVEVEREGYRKVWSQRNIDVGEPLRPGKPHSLEFSVGNPLAEPMTVTLGLIPHVQGWEIEVVPMVLRDMQPGDTHTATLTVQPPPGRPLPEDGTVIVDVEGYAEGKLIGGFRKIHRPPVPIHQPDEPPYAESEISVDPYPPRAGEPTEICTKVRNHTGITQTVLVEFSLANFGIGLPFVPIGPPRPVELPPYSEKLVCVKHVFTYGGHFCVQVRLTDPAGENPPVRSQRNLDVAEFLEPGKVEYFEVPVGNPFPEPVTITLALVNHVPGWEMDYEPKEIPNAPPWPAKPTQVGVWLTPTGDLAELEDGKPVLHLEAYANGELIGGIRKVFRPPVPIHRPADPVYAEREITVHPYPPRAREPTEVCVELRNPTMFTQTVTVRFFWAYFGIGLPFHQINGPRPVVLPPHSVVKECITWIPPVGGRACIKVELEKEGYRKQWSQKNIDIGEPLRPGEPHSLEFMVGNPLERPMTVTLGLIPHVAGWEIEVVPDTLLDMQPGEERPVMLTVQPPPGRPLPEDGTVIVDVEGYAEGRLIGGFRKIHRPPVPIHRPRDPVYAESEIGVDPYPAMAGKPTKLSVEVHNPTPVDRVVIATFSIAPFGIGLPFTTAHITPNPIAIFVPAWGAAKGHVIWMPPWAGKFCVQVELEVEGYEPVKSQRNIDVGEPLRPGIPHSLAFQVGNPYEEPVTITLGLIQHQHGWDISVSPMTMTNVPAGERVQATLMVTPARDAKLGTGRPIVDVEAHVDGRLLGGFRKLDRPPIPIHKPHEKDYAETEITVDPDPPKKGEETTITVELQNSGPSPVPVTVEFGWAKFGMGIAFTTTGIVSPTQLVTVDAGMTTTASTKWFPELAGPQCVMAIVQDAAGEYEPQRSQRNVRVIEEPPCGTTKVFTFTVRNDSPFTVTVEIGMVSFNVPADWMVTTDPTDTLEILPFEEGTVTVTVEIPCPISAQQALAVQQVRALQAAAGSVPTIDVEGYVNGDLVGGIEIQLLPETVWQVYLPVVLNEE